jgi:putative exosortase-associated protein (TIGR04073 family)
MKKLLCFLLIAGFTGVASADIQDPPANDYGPTRKLGRSIANWFPLTALTEIPDTIATINEREGNSAAMTYGVVKGFGRFFFRFGVGWYEFLTWPIPTYKGSYRPPYRSVTPWLHGGYTEFPPELGFETRYRYSRAYYAYPHTN